MVVNVSATFATTITRPTVIMTITGKVVIVMIVFVVAMKVFYFLLLAISFRIITVLVWTIMPSIVMVLFMVIGRFHHVHVRAGPGVVVVIGRRVLVVGLNRVHGRARALAEPEIVFVHVFVLFDLVVVLFFVAGAGVHLHFGDFMWVDL
ncbi:hypothetical protein CASFOL_020953 [Castilleja foliolosa]|uniref:Uncharacterized protein n=1 Tax=Castilleja foliolosa TaxID=1961234 RepID=A0ABD3D4F1_9LAMI